MSARVCLAVYRAVRKVTCPAVAWSLTFAWRMQ